MGKNTLTIEIGNIRRSVTINVLEPEFIKGYWTSDKEGQEILKKAKLEQTVYFHVETKGLAVGQELTMQLYDYDHTLWIDNIDPDDDEFPEKKVIKKAIVKTKGSKRIATVKLLLDQSWEALIKDDSDGAFALDESLELYWEVSYGKRKKILPNNSDNYLKVTFSDRTLYIKTPMEGYNLPEFIAYDGSPMLLMQFTDTAKEVLKDKVTTIIADKAQKNISNIAFAKLDKDILKNQPYTKNYLNDYYTNDPKLLESLKDKKNWNYLDKSPDGIKTLEYYSKNGNRVTVLGALKNIGTAFDIFDLVKFTMSDLDTSEPFPSLGVLTPISELTKFITLQQTQDMNVYLEDALQRDLAHAKTKGLKEIEKFVRVYGDSDGFRLAEISKETVNKLLQGEFKTMEELREYEENLDFSDFSKINVLYRIVENKNRDEDIYIIETIFIDE
ncbi:MAG: hypothetical protein L3J23_08865 [Flavobacteriaceae bacterium]|nr:hypothetical protein [Flavobacteriaceae bacterium]